MSDFDRAMKYIDMRIHECEAKNHDHLGFRLDEFKRIRAALAAREADGGKSGPDLWLYHWPKTGQRSISKRRLEPGVGAGDEYACYRADNGTNELAREYADDGLQWNAPSVAQPVAVPYVFAIIPKPVSAYDAPSKYCLAHEQESWARGHTDCRNAMLAATKTGAN